MATINDQRIWTISESEVMIGTIDEQGATDIKITIPRYSISKVDLSDGNPKLIIKNTETYAPSIVPELESKTDTSITYVWHVRDDDTAVKGIVQVVLDIKVYSEDSLKVHWISRPGEFEVMYTLSDPDESTEG